MLPVLRLRFLIFDEAVELFLAVLPEPQYRREHSNPFRPGRKVPSLIESCTIVYTIFAYSPVGIRDGQPPLDQADGLALRDRIEPAMPRSL